MSDPAPDMIPGRVPHRQAPWYRALAAIAALLIALMIGVTCIDVIGRYLLDRPFGGAYELTQILLAAQVFVALHLFPRRVQVLMGRFAGYVSALALAYFAYRLVVIGLDQWHEGTRSASLMLPMAPLAFLAAASCAVSSLVLLWPRKETLA